ncbi:UxaA family hydrolase [Paenibacillus radicis (ex Xue et al. 2023)]|uniref:UxaA family hydrolase n=1 Tax=Paenibacillus radicis (ex Xue et al. 2023) TaxID=2972489 RepID=A0ABT1YR36_9BACL|nr:UxaA family hydrolase [Paenibacillus radicis (ex Xue et al. 2023)]MCR8635631.1 UxaA family hydrolase [Paenibacillus radicis (ex Xue et al. 2023)]
MKGFKRADGRIGIRNHIAVIYTVECAHHVADSIARSVPGAEVFGFAGCYSDPYAFRMLVELGKHPNVAGVIVVRLGCESTDVDALVKQISASGKRVELIIIQEAGGSLSSIHQGKALAAEMVRHAHEAATVDMALSDLVIGVECGGSDATSGISANPAAGWAVDYFVDQGATVIFSELPELLGCNDYLLERIADEAIKQQLLDGLERANELGNKLEAFAVSSGNEQGGLTTIEEKSLGALCKAGTKPINGIIRPGQRPSRPGLYLLDKVGRTNSQLSTHYEENDNDGLVTLIASGAHILLFTTGRGSVVGSVVSPVIKICGNPLTCRRMADNMDIKAGSIIEGTRTVAEIGLEIVEKVALVADGKPTQAELLGHKEYYIPYKPSRACELG